MYVTTEQEERLKQIGYDCYYEGKDIRKAATFLRDRHGLHVYSIPFVQDKYTAWDRRVIDLKTGECLYNNRFHDTHDLAYAAGITAALDIVEQRNKK